MSRYDAWIEHLEERCQDAYNEDIHESFAEWADMDKDAYGEFKKLSIGHDMPESCIDLEHDNPRWETFFRWVLSQSAHCGHWVDWYVSKHEGGLYRE